MRKLAILLVSAVTAFSGVVPAQALPLASAPVVERSQDVQQVQYRHWRHGDRNWHRGHGGWNRHRYYRDHGWRRHHRGPNAGAIIGGLAAGAIIGGALAQPRYYGERRYVRGSSHQQWCAARYRSYRAYDNTFQPYNGPRQQCVSP